MSLIELLVGGSALWLLPVSLLVFGAAFGLVPGLLLRGIILFYPKDDPRRQELFGELYAPEMTRLGRHVWVFQQLETALRDGLVARRLLRRAQRESRELMERHELLPCPRGSDDQSVHDRLGLDPTTAAMVVLGLIAIGLTAQRDPGFTEERLRRLLPRLRRPIPSPLRPIVIREVFVQVAAIPRSQQHRLATGLPLLDLVDQDVLIDELIEDVRRAEGNLAS